MKRKIQLLTMIAVLVLPACAMPAFAEGGGPAPTIMLPGSKPPEGGGPAPTLPPSGHLSAGSPSLAAR
jgi:hypothetical protein